MQAFVVFYSPPPIQDSFSKFRSYARDLTQILDRYVGSCVNAIRRQHLLPPYPDSRDSRIAKIELIQELCQLDVVLISLKLL
jgi:hypothetical protein